MKSLFCICVPIFNPVFFTFCAVFPCFSHVLYTPSGLCTHLHMTDWDCVDISHLECSPPEKNWVSPKQFHPLKYRSLPGNCAFCNKFSLYWPVSWFHPQFRDRRNHTILCLWLTICLQICKAEVWVSQALADKRGEKMQDFTMLSI